MDVGETGSAAVLKAVPCYFPTGSTVSDLTTLCLKYFLFSRNTSVILFFAKRLTAKRSSHPLE